MNSPNTPSPWPTHPGERQALAMRLGDCFECPHARRVDSAKGSVFWRCDHPKLPKYPPLPRWGCLGRTDAPA